MSNEEITASHTYNTSGQANCYPCYRLSARLPDGGFDRIFVGNSYRLPQNLSGAYLDAGCEALSGMIVSFRFSQTYCLPLNKRSPILLAELVLASYDAPHFGHVIPGAAVVGFLRWCYFGARR